MRSLNTERRRAQRMYCVTLLVMTAVFAALYMQFLLGVNLYAYRDVGSDTTNQYLPQIIFDIRNVRAGGVGQYQLQCGLGEYYGATFYNYYDLIDLPLLLFGEELLHWGLMVSLYIKYICICFFSMLYFRRLFRDIRLASIGALLWTFSSYLVLWGQHYKFLTVMAAFTVSMWGLQLLLEHDRKRILLIPALFTLADTSYYFFYVSCFFFFVYSICYLLFCGTPRKEIVKKIAVLIGCSAFSLGIAGAYILPAMADFFASTRMTDVRGQNQSFSLLYTGRSYMALVARLLSNDTLGVGSPYTGPTNYYEAAMLCVSVLFIFSLVLLCTSPWRRKTLVLVAFGVVLLSLPMVSWLLGFNVERQRWTYFLCFAEVLLIGFGLKYFFENRTRPEFRKTVLLTVCISDVVYLIFIGLLFATAKRYEFTIYTAVVNLILVLLAVYSLFFIGVTVWKSRYAYVILTALVAVELTATNYKAVNERGLVTTEDWYQSMYYDGTEEIVEWIHEQDQSLYRINKTYDSVRCNDGMVQGYNSVGVYHSTVPAEVVNLYLVQNFADTNQSVNWIRFSGYDRASNMLLGVKYVIAQTGEQLDERLYREIYSDETYTVFESIYDSGFGYLYYEQLTEEDYLSMTWGEQYVALTQAYYETGSKNSAGEPKGSGHINGFQRMDLFPYYQGGQLCKTELDDTLHVWGDEDDMQLYFEVPYGPEGWIVSDVVVTMEAEKDSIIQLYLQSDEMEYYSDDVSFSLECKAGKHTYRLPISYTGNAMELRIDPSQIKQDVEISDVTLVFQDPNQMAENLKQRQENSMTDFRQDGNTFYGTITNTQEQQAMLCIPLIYNDHWVVSVDGKPTEIQNINGGLVGLPLETGQHEIVLTYQDHTRQIGRVVGLVFLAVYLLGAGFWWKRKGKYETG